MICATGQASIPARCVIQTVPGRSADRRVTPDICAHSRRPECDLTTFCRDAIRPWVCCRVRPLRRSGSCPELTSLSCREEVPLRRTLYVPNTGEAFSATPGIGRPAVTSPEWKIGRRTVSFGLLPGRRPGLSLVGANGSLDSVAGTAGRRADRLSCHSGGGGHCRRCDDSTTRPPRKEETVAGRGDDVRTIAQHQRTWPSRGADRTFGDRVGLTVAGSSAWSRSTAIWPASGNTGWLPIDLICELALRWN